jgi:hypothetical protein
MTELIVAFHNSAKVSKKETYLKHGSGTALRSSSMPQSNSRFHWSCQECLLQLAVKELTALDIFRAAIKCPAMQDRRCSESANINHTERNFLYNLERDRQCKRVNWCNLFFYLSVGMLYVCMYVRMYVCMYYVCMIMYVFVHSTYIYKLVLFTCMYVYKLMNALVCIQVYASLSICQCDWSLEHQLCQSRPDYEHIWMEERNVRSCNFSRKKPLVKTRS